MVKFGYVSLDGMVPCLGLDGTTNTRPNLKNREAWKMISSFQVERVFSFVLKVS